MAESFCATALAPALLAGDDAAVRQLVDHALPRLVRIAVSAGANPADAEDVAMDAIFSSLTRLPTLDFSQSKSADPLFSYMATAAENRVHEAHRRRRREREALASAVGGAREDATVLSLDAPVHPSATRHHGDRPGRSVWEVDADLDPPNPGRTDAMRRFLRELGDEDRLLVELRAFSREDTWIEIAGRMGIMPAAARQRWSRLQKKANRIVEGEEALNDQPA